MLKERKLRKKNYLDEYYYGYCKIDGYDGYIEGEIKDENIIKEISDTEYYFAEVKTSAFDSDYHSYAFEYGFQGVFLNFNLNEIDTKKYFGVNFSNFLFPKDELIKITEKLLKRFNMINKYYVHDIAIKNGCLKITIPNKKLDNEMLDFCSILLQEIRNYYSNKGIHITRMFGSYILIKNENDKLKAVAATPIPIKYCPLMIKLLKEVGEECAEELLNSLQSIDSNKQTQLMCELINQAVIGTGYFDTNRSLNSCEANVLFGASETISSAFKNNMLDAAVIVSNNLGTIITTNDTNTQGAVKRMTGLFYTSPSEELVNEAERSKIIPVFPYTAEIDQLEGIKEAIRRGYKRIAVTLASYDNVLLEEIKKLETNDIKIYKFALCSTGIDKKTAQIMLDNADIVWSCASKYVKEYIEPNAIAQVGVKIPVHILTESGWHIISNHLEYMMKNNIGETYLTKGEEKPIFINGDTGIKKVLKKEIKKCTDCPNPCI